MFIFDRENVYFARSFLKLLFGIQINVPKNMLKKIPVKNSVQEHVTEEV
jgi:hypothetical protein